MSKNDENQPLLDKDDATTDYTAEGKNAGGKQPFFSIWIFYLFNIFLDRSCIFRLQSTHFGTFYVGSMNDPFSFSFLNLNKVTTERRKEIENKKATTEKVVLYVSVVIRLTLV